MPLRRRRLRNFWPAVAHVLLPLLPLSAGARRAACSECVLRIGWFSLDARRGTRSRLSATRGAVLRNGLLQSVWRPCPPRLDVARDGERAGGFAGYCSGDRSHCSYICRVAHPLGPDHGRDRAVCGCSQSLIRFLDQHSYGTMRRRLRRTMMLRSVGGKARWAQSVRSQILQLTPMRTAGALSETPSEYTRCEA